MSITGGGLLRTRCQHQYRVMFAYVHWRLHNCCYWYVQGINVSVITVGSEVCG